MTGVPKSSGAQSSIIEVIGHLELCLYHLAKNHLGNTHTSFNGKQLLPQIDQNNLDFPAIVGINGSGCIQDRDSVLDRKPASGTDLGFRVARQTNRKARGNSFRSGFNSMLSRKPQADQCRLNLPSYIAEAPTRQNEKMSSLAL